VTQAGTGREDAVAARAVGEGYNPALQSQSQRQTLPLDAEAV